MTEADLAEAVRTAVDAWMRSASLELCIASVENDPDGLGSKLAVEVGQLLNKKKIAFGGARQLANQAPYLHLRQVFVPSDLSETPKWFNPVPNNKGSLAGRASALAVHRFLHKETVSYGSENDGALFVNIVPIPGDGQYAHKSRKSMRGHTDAVTFPFIGDFDAENGRIAPSPDLVTLIGLRNPDLVPTTVMALEDVLRHLSADVIAELKKNQYSIIAQKTFILGTRDILGDVHTIIDEPLLKDHEAMTLARYSHSSVFSTEPDGTAQRAAEQFELACSQCVQKVVIEPGDLFIINNRLCLHGRGEVGQNKSGEPRWLLRTYGLDTSKLDPNRRHLNGRPSYMLYP